MNITDFYPVCLIELGFIAREFKKLYGVKCKSDVTRQCVRTGCQLLEDAMREGSKTGLMQLPVGVCYLSHSDKQREAFRLFEQALSVLASSMALEWSRAPRPPWRGTEKFLGQQTMLRRTAWSLGSS